MDELREVLSAIGELRKDIEVNNAVNVEQHGEINRELGRMNNNLEEQNHRINSLEHFRTVLKTRQILIPAVISLMIGGIGLAIKLV